MTSPAGAKNKSVSDSDTRKERIMGLFDFLKGKSSVQKVPVQKTDDKIKKAFHQQAAPIVPEKPQKPNVYIPNRVGDCLRVYFYQNIKFQPYEIADSLADEMVKSNDWALTPIKSGDRIDLYYHETPFAILSDRVDMVSDWLKRNDPMVVILQNMGPSGNFASIAFYRNEEKRLASHESTVVKLVRYANEDAQFNLSGLEPGEKLDLEEDYEREDSVNVLYGAEIGALPKKQSQRYIEEGCAGVFLDHIDIDDNLKDVPYVKIYW